MLSVNWSALTPSRDSSKVKILLSGSEIHKTWILWYEKNEKKTEMKCQDEIQ